MMILWESHDSGGYMIRMPIGYFYLSTQFLDDDYNETYTAALFTNESVLPVLKQNFSADDDYHAKEKAIAIFRNWVAIMQMFVKGGD